MESGDRARDLFLLSGGREIDEVGGDVKFGRRSARTISANSSAKKKRRRRLPCEQRWISSGAEEEGVWREAQR